jgi:hypothetical protein
LENAVYSSYDDGEHWQQLQLNMPHAPVYGMVIQEHFNDLVIATYGRGFYILDDLTPLQSLTTQIASSDLYLFAPRPAYRFVDVQGNVSSNDDPTAGQNPTYGASINYWVSGDTQGTAKIEILDAANKLVRTITDSSVHAGLNRVSWDLRNETSRAPRMKTKPQFNAEFAMNEDGTRDAAGVGTISVLMPPGRYTVRLTRSNKTLTQPLEVRRDPNQGEALADIKAATDAMLAIQKDHAASAQMIGQIESVRAQLQALGSNAQATADIKTQGDALERKFMDVEARLVDPRLTGHGQDEVRYPVKTAGQLSWLAGGVGASDYAPTAQQKEVAGILAAEVRSTRTALDELLRKDLAAFNGMLQQKGIKTIEAGGVVF